MATVLLVIVAGLSRLTEAWVLAKLAFSPKQAAVVANSGLIGSLRSALKLYGVASYLFLLAPGMAFVRVRYAYYYLVLVGAAFALYPNVLPASTGPEYSLTIFNTAAGSHGLSVGLVWWTLGMLLATGYFVFIYRMFRGKVRLEEGSGHGY